MRDEQGRTALHLAVLFKGTGETAILEGTAQSDNKSSEDEGSQLRSMQRYCRGGCEVERLNCKSETWVSLRRLHRL